MSEHLRAVAAAIRAHDVAIKLPVYWMNCAAYREHRPFVYYPRGDLARALDDAADALDVR